MHKRCAEARCPTVSAHSLLPPLCERFAQFRGAQIGLVTLTTRPVLDVLSGQLSLETK